MVMFVLWTHMHSHGPEAENLFKAFTLKTTIESRDCSLSLCENGCV